MRCPQRNPADFPLGSPQSRAAARALLQAKAPRMSQSVQFDEDAYVIYRVVCEHFDATMNPTYHEVEPTEVYTRGKEVRDTRHGPMIPFHLDEHAKRSTLASREFESAFGCEPKAGDMLRCYHVGIMRNPELSSAWLGRFFGAWRRQLPQMICPLKFEDGRLLKRLTSGSWKEDLTIQPQAWWWGVAMRCVWPYLWRVGLWNNAPPVARARSASPRSDANDWRRCVSGSGQWEAPMQASDRGRATTAGD